MDHRDDKTWVVIELSRFGELRVEEGSLEKIIRRDLDVDSEYPIFIPAASYVKNGKTITIQLLEGYAFVASGLPETKYFKLEKRNYVNQVMSARATNLMRALQVITNDEVENMRVRLRSLVASELTEGDLVRVVEGRYSGLDGEVVDVFDGDYATVSFIFRSLSVLATMPVVFLETLS